MESRLKRIYINPNYVDGDCIVQIAKYMESYLRDNFMVSVKKNSEIVDEIHPISHEANSWNANLFVSIQNNNSNDKSEVLVYNKSNRRIANTFLSYLNDISIDFRDDIPTLYLPNMKSVIINCSINGIENLNTFGESLAKAAAEVLKLPKKSKVPVFETLYNLNLKESIKPYAKIIGFIPKGTVIRGSIGSDGWLRTTYMNKTGYIKQQDNERIYCKRIY